MKFKPYILLLLLMGALIIVLAAGCKADDTPYDLNNQNGYTLSVKFDANGGYFGNSVNTSVIVDSFNPSDMPVNKDGMIEIALLSPDDVRRGEDGVREVQNPGCFLAGWYARRTESTDSDGNRSYSYSDKWNFDSPLTADPAGNYTACEPYLTLYALWIPKFEIEFYSLSDGELIDTLEINPLTEPEILLPHWPEGSVSIEMEKFPKKLGYSYNGAYMDRAGTTPVEGASVTHCGTIDFDTGVAENTVMKLYIAWIEGETFRIYNAEQFIDNYSPTGRYEILADLDFGGKWSDTITRGTFNGTINGNGHIFSNIDKTLTSNSNANLGLFGQIGGKATLNDLVFENIEIGFNVNVKQAGSSYGLFAGTVASGAKFTDVTVRNCVLAIYSEVYELTTDYSLGLLIGTGDDSVINAENVNCVASGEDPDSITVTVDDNNTVSFEKKHN